MNSEKAKSDEDLIAIARSRFDLAVEMYREERELALEDIKFSAGDQWSASDKRLRQLEGKPTLTNNRLPQFIRQITNDLRQNRPSINIQPVDDKADTETAAIYKGMIRHIQYNSQSDVAYDRASDSAVRGGFGFYRITTDYVSPDSFDQEILIKSIPNPFNVYLGPHDEPDGSDAEWGFIFEDLVIEDYKKDYPSAKCDLEDWRSIGDSAPNWATDKTRRVAEYFYKDYKKTKLHLLSDGSTILEGEIETRFPNGIRTFEEVEANPLTDEQGNLVAEIFIEQTRETETCEVKWIKMNGLEELDKGDWAGKYIPIIPVYGDEVVIDGKKIHEGITRHAKDPQKMLNYWQSIKAETIALSPRSPWIVAEGQIEGYEHIWKTANKSNHAYLPYKLTSLPNGQPAPPPQRNSFEPPVMALTQASMQEVDNLKAVTGIYDAALGNQSNETSGIAIRSRASQAQTSNFHFSDNLLRSQRYEGRQLVDLIPKIYDTKRASRILGEDDKEEIILLNQVFERKGKEVKYDLGHGKYDVIVSNGPSYETKRQEALDAMLELTRTMPQLPSVASDLIVKLMDMPMKDELADRLKKTLPPGILNEEGADIPPQVAQKIQQYEQFIEQMTAQLKETSEDLKNEKNETRRKIVELEFKERMESEKLRLEWAKLEADLKKTEVKEQGLDERLLLQEANQAQRNQDQLKFKSEQVSKPGDADAQNQSLPINQQPTGGSSPGQFMGE